ncbi:MAG: peptidylprolyl isomerase [Clostridia bacterium]|nr:peptidylprolyl isomerase [Clostridia bacterium]
MKNTKKILAILLAFIIVAVGATLGAKWYNTAKEKKQLQEAQEAYDKDMSTVVATYKGGEVTKGEVVAEYENEALSMRMYMEYMYMMFSGQQEAYELTEEEKIEIRNGVIDRRAAEEVLRLKMIELTGKDFTEEELSAFASEANEMYNMYLAYYMSMGMDQQSAMMGLMIDGIDAINIERQARKAEIEKRLTEHVGKDASVTEEETHEAFLKTLEEQKAEFTENPEAIEDLYQSESNIYYMPEGFKYVKHILIMPEDETLLANISQKQQAFDNLKAELETLEAEDAEGNQDGINQKKEALAVAEKELSDANDALLNSVKADTDGIYLALESGESFDALIETHSQDTGSFAGIVKEKGYLVYDESTRWDPAFLKAVNTLTEVGQVSEPVIGMYGVHILKYDSAALIGEIEYESVKDKVYEETLQLKKEKLFDENSEIWLAEAEIVYDYDKMVLE